MTHKMQLWSCEKWKPDKCQSTEPCALLAPKTRRPPTGCPLEKKSRFVRVPIVELTV